MNRISLKGGEVVKLGPVGADTQAGPATAPVVCSQNRRRCSPRSLVEDRLELELYVPARRNVGK